MVPDQLLRTVEDDPAKKMAFHLNGLVGILQAFFRLGQQGEFPAHALGGWGQ